MITIKLDEKDSAFLLVIKNRRLKFMPKMDCETYRGYLERACGYLYTGCEANLEYFVYLLYLKLKPEINSDDLISEMIMPNMHNYGRSPLEILLGKIKFLNCKKLDLDKSLVHSDFIE